MAMLWAVWPVRMRLPMPMPILLKVCENYNISLNPSRGRTACPMTSATGLGLSFPMMLLGAA